MFSWHETTWRGLVRLAFGLFVAVPTCAVLLTVAWVRCPLSLEYYRRAIAEQLALDVRLEHVRFPRPGATIYEGLSLFDPETAQPLARFAVVEWQSSGQKSSITCHQAEFLDSSRLDLLAELVSRRMRSLAESKNAIEIDAPRLTVQMTAGSEPIVLVDVRGRLRATGTAEAAGNPPEPQGMLKFHLSEHNEGAPTRIWFDRGPAGAGATALKLETGPTALPARLVDLCCPGWATWGMASSFRGELWWQKCADGLAGEVRGHISGIELDALVSTRSEHRLSGQAEVRLERARFKAGRLLDASGSIAAGPGGVSRSLLADVASQLHAEGNHPSAARSDLAAYDELAFGFVIDQRGIVLHGLCTKSAKALFVGPAGPMLVQPEQRQSLLDVVRLMSTSGLVVPADPAAQSLLGVLPVPEPSAADSSSPTLRRNSLRR